MSLCSNDSSGVSNLVANLLSNKKPPSKRFLKFTVNALIHKQRENPTPDVQRRPCLLAIMLAAPDGFPMFIMLCIMVL